MPPHRTQARRGSDLPLDEPFGLSRNFQLARSFHGILPYLQLNMLGIPPHSNRFYLLYRTVADCSLSVACWCLRFNDHTRAQSALFAA